ncbi:MAG TPA: hypothetical protein VIO58_08265 [Candidatus Methanoperedens sp.]
MPHHTEVTFGSPVFRIVAADIGELRTALCGYPPFSVLLEQFPIRVQGRIHAYEK